MAITLVFILLNASYIVMSAIEGDRVGIGIGFLGGMLTVLMTKCDVLLRELRGK